MTIADFESICYEKIFQKNPLRLPEPPSVAHSEEGYRDIMTSIVENYEANSQFSTLLMDAISEVWQSLANELGIDPKEVHALPKSTPLPPAIEILAQKLSQFPEEITADHG